MKICVNDWYRSTGSPFQDGRLPYIVNHWPYRRRLCENGARIDEYMGAIVRCMMFFMVIGLCTGQATVHAAQNPLAMHIQLNDEIINPITAEYIIEALNRAQDNRATCLIIELDTPGGLLNSTRLIVKNMLNSSVPIIVYVSPQGSRAASAGVFITYAAHVAVMAPSTNIGAAHPVNLGGSRGPDARKIKEYFEKKTTQENDQADDEKKQDNKPRNTDVMADKIVNDTVAWIRTIARQRDRNEDWAEQSVRESVSIHEDRALEIGVIDVVAKNLEELMQAVDGRTVRVADDREVRLNTADADITKIPMNFRQRLLNILVNPNLAYILMILGFYGLLYEFTHPGIGFPGIAGVIAIILAFFSMQMLPTNYAGVALIGLAVALFIAEVWVPSFGLLTLGGIISMVLGSLILFESPAEYLRVSISIIIPLVLTTAGITFFLVRLVVKSQRRKTLTGIESMIGMTGEASGRIDKKGKIFINGELWNVETDEPVEDGEKVTVIGREGMILKIKKGG
ncbi:MAG: nodulation protein NfeD [Elusimicrobia bacterium]|nr:nodulation protein NfeD [Elusimicrobiota bacterium]MBD3411877.1 nodulation protein NfeD [Elusimicrobiota bacterium]